MRYLDEYIKETEDYVLPLLRITKTESPEYHDELFVLKYHITSVLNAVKGIKETYKLNK